MIMDIRIWMSQNWRHIETVFADTSLNNHLIKMLCNIMTKGKQINCPEVKFSRYTYLVELQKIVDFVLPREQTMWLSL